MSRNEMVLQFEVALNIKKQGYQDLYMKNEIIFQTTQYMNKNYCVILWELNTAAYASKNFIRMNNTQLLLPILYRILQKFILNGRIFFIIKVFSKFIKFIFSKLRKKKLSGQDLNHKSFYLHALCHWY